MKHVTTLLSVTAMVLTISVQAQGFGWNSWSMAQWQSGNASFFFGGGNSVGNVQPQGSWQQPIPSVFIPVQTRPANTPIINTGFRTVQDQKINP